MKVKKVLKYILIFLAIVLVIAIIRQIFKENIGIKIKELKYFRKDRDHFIKSRKWKRKRI